MGRPQISVIVPTFGRIEQVRRAVQSVVVQDVDLEVIVVDDGSPQQIDLDAPRVRVVRLEQNGGAAAARNAGVVAAQADWLAFLDSDDVWTPGSLRPRFEAAKAAPDSDRTIWAAAFVDVFSDGSRSAPRVPRASVQASDFVSGCWMCPGSTALMNRAAWLRSGGQDASLRRLEDYEWLLRWGVEGGRLAVYPGVAAEITRGGRAAPENIAGAADAINAKHVALPPALARRMRSYLKLEQGAALLHVGDVIGGAAALAHSWLLHPRMQPALEPFWD